MLLEIIISIAVISIAFVVLLGIGFTVLQISNSIQKQIQANSLVVEELEALRSFRDATIWDTTGIGTALTGSSNPYYMQNNADSWELVAGSEITGIFTRRIVFDRAYRDPDGKLSLSGTEDSDARKITVTVSWPGKNIQTITYLTNWK